MRIPILSLRVDDEGNTLIIPREYISSQNWQRSLTGKRVLKRAEAGPQSYAPKQSDYTIAEIASKRGGVYSPFAHEMSDPSVREEYIKAHVRRLEALRRKGHAERNSDGSWKLPRDYLKRASDFEKSRGFGNPVELDILSRSSFGEQLNKLKQDTH